MDFDFPAEDDPRRLEVRQWFEEHPNASYKQIAEKGYAAPNWPAPWGMSADPELQLIIDEEMRHAGIIPPIDFNPIAVNQCGQTVATIGTKEQQEKFLPRALSCEATWCMLFSEPSGGSDLAGARTQARREGDHYIVNGQKIWNSGAHRAEIGILIARTDPTVPKHKGLSVFIMDMKTPGVEVRPIRDMTGEKSEFNEVFLTDVKIPADRLLGREGDGWNIVISQLQTERMGMTAPGAVWGHGPTARELIQGLAESGRLSDPLLRDEAAKLFIEGELLRLLTYRHLSNRINGKPAGLEGNIGKMVSAPHGQRLSDLAKRSVGAAGMLVRSTEDLPLSMGPHRFNNWDYSYWFGVAGTLGVGTQEVLKTSVAERMLGLPRDHDPSASVPFNEIIRPQLKTAS
ncbi:MAG: acyl-CoA dehydrogenase family protein [Hyphomonadaceae bacterium]